MAKVGPKCIDCDEVQWQFIFWGPRRGRVCQRRPVTPLLLSSETSDKVFNVSTVHRVYFWSNPPLVVMSFTRHATSRHWQKRRNFTWSVVNFRLEWHLFVTTTKYSHTLRQPVTLFSTAIMISASASDFTFLFWKIHIGAMCKSERHWSFSITWSSIVFTWIKCVTRNLFWIGFFVIHQVVSLFHKWNDDKTKIVGTNKNFVFFLFRLTHKGDAG